MAQRSSGGTGLVRFTIKAVGPSRSEKQIRQDVADALAEALQNYKSQTKNSRARAEVEPEGAFTGVELAAWWLLKTLAGGAVGTAGGAAVKKLYTYFARSLKKRNLDPGPPTVIKDSVPSKKAEPKRKTKDPKKK